MLKLLRYLKPFTLQIVLAVGLLFIQANADLALPDYMSRIVNVGIQQGRSEVIPSLGLIMLGLSLVTGVCTIAVSYLSARTAAGFTRTLRRDVFRKVSDFSSAELNRFSTASLITRSTNDITQVGMLVLLSIRMFAYAPIMAVGGTIRAMNKDLSMWWTIALAVVVLIGIIAVVFSIALPKFRIVQKLVDRLNLVTRENLAGMMVIRAFNRQDFEEQRFDQANQDLTANTLFVSRLMTTMMPTMMLLMNAVTILIIWVGSHQVAQASMQVGDMMAFMQYAMQIVFSFLMLSFVFIMFPRASVSGDRVAEVLDTQPAIHDPAQPADFPQPFRGLVEFRDVCFRYPGAEENVLDEISFTAQPGQTTAIIGSTGSGKSTVVNLIPRFYDVTCGQILIDGIDIRQVSQHALRDKIGYIPQRGVLFSGTIESNLRYAAEQATLDDLDCALEIAQAAEFVAARPEGLQADIAQGGGNVSGGQKQRLSIARALVKQAPIYIFDDSFSALDFKTDAALRRALKERTAGSTILIVTQRISTIMTAEQIIVLDDGRIAGKGTHHELMKTCQVYREMALSQLSMEELA
jgi:ATP-binding cassette subfamily B protein